MNEGIDGEAYGVNPMCITALKAPAGSGMGHIYLNQYQCQGNGTRGALACHCSKNQQGEDYGGD
jgi:hypothetical protein